MIVPCRTFDLQAHRGGRGLMPENTIPAFRRAIALGVTTLETDLTVTRDGVVVLAHDPVLNPDITRAPDGEWITCARRKLLSMTLAEIRLYDVGRIKPGTDYARQFASQTPVDGTSIPTLSELLDLICSTSMVARLNLEIKISPLAPQDTPDPEAFMRLVVESVRLASLVERVMIQAFDWRVLRIARQLEPGIVTACLTSQTPAFNTIGSEKGTPSPWLAGLDAGSSAESVPRLVRSADCEIWSPDFMSLTPSTIDEAHELGLKVIPWTVNAISDMRYMIDLGVDGLISDYPDRALPILAERGLRPR